MIAALFVDKGGAYWSLDEVDAWDIERDARKYTGPFPVVAHPPCNRWGKLGAINFKRWGGEHNRPGNDGGCFYSAFMAVNTFGGVLEHPAESQAWPTFGLQRPKKGVWTRSGKGWVCEVAQSAYGHKARKLTWLYYVGPKPAELIWDCPSGTHQIGFQDQRGKGRNKPTLSKKEANKTPLLFKELLCHLARQCVSREN